MGQTIFVPSEIDAAETRVAASPETVKRLAGLGFSVIVEKDAGAASRIPDADFAAAGALIGSLADHDGAAMKPHRRPIARLGQ